jgi:copper(I)-binding protein
MDLDPGGKHLMLLDLNEPILNGASFDGIPML